MILSDIDWVDFFRRLPVWERLALDTRGVLAKLKPNKAANAARVGDDLQCLAKAKFVIVYVDGKRIRLHKDCSSFLRAIRAMYRHEVLGRPNAKTLSGYIQDAYTYPERSALASDPASYANDVDALAARVLSIRWLEDFLAIKNFQQSRLWESARQPNVYSPHGNSDKQILATAEAFHAAQSMIRKLMSSTEPVAFQDLSKRFTSMSLPLLATVVRAGIRYLLLFPTMRVDDMTPMITLWPTILQRLHRPKAKPPKTVEPDETFHCAFLMEDMTTLLIATAGEPLRIRSDDYGLFAKAQKRLESNLQSVPEWLTGIDACTPAQRIGVAQDFLRQLELIETQGTRGKDLRLESTPKAQEWLGLSGKDRLKHLLDHLKSEVPRKSKQGKVSAPIVLDPDEAEDAARLARDPQVLAGLETFDDDDEDEYDDGYAVESFSDSYYYARRLGFLPQTMQRTLRSTGEVVLSAALVDAYGALARRRFVPFGRFVEHRMREANPLLNGPSDGKPLDFRIGWSWRAPTDEEVEETWGQFLEDFFRFRLLPLGCVQVGLMGTGGELCICLTDAGRYFLGRAKDFDYGCDQDPKGHVVVQPNFDVVFLSPAPLAEATVAPFAHRTGNGTGTVFKITKKSIFTAASSGITSRQVLDALRDVSSKAVPTNVTREIEGWFGYCGRVAVKPALLIHCPDTRIANRVLAAGGRKLESITDTIIELADREFESTLVRKLKEAGVFIDRSAQPEESTPARRRRRW